MVSAWIRAGMSPSAKKTSATAIQVSDGELSNQSMQRIDRRGGKLVQRIQRMAEAGGMRRDVEDGVEHADEIDPALVACADTRAVCLFHELVDEGVFLTLSSSAESTSSMPDARCEHGGDVFAEGGVNHVSISVKREITCLFSTPSISYSVFRAVVKASSPYPRGNVIWKSL